MKSHLQKAQYNENFLSEFERLMPNDYFDWKITVCFYICVHYLGAYFKTHGVTINSHEHRLEKMDDEYIGVSQTCWDNYNNLYRITRTARYNGFEKLAEFTRYQKEKLKEAKKNMKEIKKFVIEDLVEQDLIDEEDYK